MRLVHLLRHASAAPGPGDHARALDEQGIAEAAAVGAHLAAKWSAPQAVLCSSARRARETLLGLRAQYTLPAAEIAEELYLADRIVLRERLAALDDAWERVLLIGHNPGIAELVRDLGRQGDEAALERSRRSFPPAALASIRFDEARWAALASRSGHLLEVWLPPP